VHRSVGAGESVGLRTTGGQPGTDDERTGVPGAPDGRAHHGTGGRRSRTANRGVEAATVIEEEATGAAPADRGV